MLTSWFFGGWAGVCGLTPALTDADSQGHILGSGI